MIVAKESDGIKALLQAMYVAILEGNIICIKQEATCIIKGKPRNLASADVHTSKLEAIGNAI